MSRPHANKKEPVTRRRYPSRGIQKGTVSDITEAFKRQMAAGSPQDLKLSGDSQKLPVKTRKRNTISKSKDPLPLPKTKEEKAIQKNINATKKRIEEQINMINSNEEINASLSEQNCNQASNDTQMQVHELRDPNNREAKESLTASLTSISEVQEASPLKDSQASTSDKLEGMVGEAVSDGLESENDQYETEEEQEVFLGVEVQIDENNLAEALKEVCNKVARFEELIYHPRNGLEYQLARQTERINNIFTDIHAATGGLKVSGDKSAQEMEILKKRVATLEQNQSRMVDILSENKRLARELALMQGVLQKQSQQHEIMENKWLDLSKRGMEQNLVIHGVPEIDNPREKENCKLAIQQFLKENMSVEVSMEHIWKAHRLGYRKEAKVRPIVTKVAYGAKELIMEHVGKLKGKINPKTELPLFISQQIPEGIAEIKKQVQARVQPLREANEAAPPGQKKDIQVINNKIMVSGKVQHPEVTTPQPQDIFLTHEKQEQIDQTSAKIVETQAIEVKNSVFTGLALEVNSIEEVNRAYIAVAQRHPTADHIMLGYGFKDWPTNTIKMGHCDDKEYGGGIALRRALAETKARDTAVFVVRKYGGIHLGPDRFKSIQTVAKKAIEQLPLD